MVYIIIHSNIWTMIYVHSADLSHQIICKKKTVFNIKNCLKFIKNYTKSVALQVINGILTVLFNRIIKKLCQSNEYFAINRSLPAIPWNDISPYIFLCFFFQQQRTHQMNYWKVWGKISYSMVYIVIYCNFFVMMYNWKYKINIKIKQFLTLKMIAVYSIFA